MFKLTSLTIQFSFFIFFTIQLENVSGSSPREKVLKDHFFIFLIIFLAVFGPRFLDDGRNQFPKLPVYGNPLKQLTFRPGLHVIARKERKG